MIISASRRTDIPAYYSDWLLNRIKEGFVCVRNPMNIHQVSKIRLGCDVIDCIVFWSKNPEPMLDKLKFFNDYTYYFQFTLNPYEKDIEQNLPTKKAIIETFKKLADRIGPQKIIWRYDPILLNNRYTLTYHIDKFDEFANKLKNNTEKVTFSFIDFYKKIMENIKLNGIIEITTEEKNIIAENFSKIANENNLLIDTCAEDIDLSKYNIDHARCIDDRLITKIIGCKLKIDKDKNQRFECGCVGSIDIGEYNSCLNGCVYCYANYSKKTVEINYKNHNKLSSLLTEKDDKDDILNEKKMFSNKISQNELF